MACWRLQTWHPHQSFALRRYRKDANRTALPLTGCAMARQVGIRCIDYLRFDPSWSGEGYASVPRIA